MPQTPNEGYQDIRELVEGTLPPLTEEDMCKCIDRKELKYEH